MRTFILINSRLEIAHWSTVPNNKKISIWYPSLITRNSSRARQPLSRVNVTELLRWLLVKIENIYLFKIIIIKKNMETSLKTHFAQIFSCSPKIWVAQTLGGLQPPSPPRTVRLWACAQKVVFCFLGLSLVDREPFAWVHRFEHAIQANTLFRRCICFHIEQKVLSAVSMNTIGNYGWVPY